MAAILLVGLLIFAAGVPISYYAARDGVDIDLLTRGAGFGYIGSTITSLIYATFTFIFFAVEAAILASVLQPARDPARYRLHNRLAQHCAASHPRHNLHQPRAALVAADLGGSAGAALRGHRPDRATCIRGLARVSRKRPRRGLVVALILFGAAGSVVFALIAQIGEQADYLRFLPPRQAGARNVRWWAALLAGGPGWIFIGILKLLASSFLACLAIAAGIVPWLAVQPSEMYRVAFGYVTGAPSLALALASVFVVVSQVKINITNAYAGSIAWSNFFARLTHNHPGRVVWLIFNIAIALLLMKLGIYQAIEHTLVIYSTIAAAWVGALVADLVVNKPLGLSPAHIEFKRAHLYDVNPVGVGAMVAGGHPRADRLWWCTRHRSGSVLALSRLLRRILHRTIDRVGHRWPFYLARKPRAHWSSCLPCDA